MASVKTFRKPTLVIACDTTTFDISPWTTEGYAVHLLTKATQRDIEDATDDLESNDRYAILAFGSAGSAALSFALCPSRQLRSLAAYYPSALPVASFHPDVQILIHLPSTAPFSLPASTTVQIRLYDAPSGFAQPGTPSYDRIATSLAFSRTLALLRATVGPPRVDLESLWDRHLLRIFHDRSVDGTMDTLVSAPYVNHVPTLTGGYGYDELLRFYRDKFVAGNPPSMRMTLVSRTVGSDRIVDEMVIKFRHTCEVPWMLPGVAPTDREVEIAVVCIVSFRGGRICQEHIYWDNASVLVQIGMLEEGGALPVVGREAARKVLDRNSVPSNGLIRDW